MKKSIKFLMVAVLTLGSTALFAQKFGRIDYGNVIYTMPEITTVMENLQKMQADYSEHIENMQVELNRKADEVANLPETTSETTKSLKNSELLAIQQRINEYYQSAQQRLQQAEIDEMTPLQDKIDAAIEKISKAQGLIAVFQEDSVIYLDKDQVVDITAAVKTELGIPADAVPVTATVPVQ